jgi:hypothetical protein
VTSPVCVGAGLTTDGDGRLVVDACAGGSLCFDGTTECLKVCTETMHRATLTHTGNLTVPASAGATASAVLVIPYNQTVDSLGGIATPPDITIAQTGRYYVAIGQRDANQAVNFGTAALHTISAELFVNGVQQLAERVPRMSSQTHVLGASKVMTLNAGDVVTGRYTVHNLAGPTAPHTLNPGATNFLQVQQLTQLSIIP